MATPKKSQYMSILVSRAFLYGYLWNIFHNYLSILSNNKLGWRLYYKITAPRHSEREPTKKCLLRRNLEPRSKTSHSASSLRQPSTVDQFSISGLELSLHKIVLITSHFFHTEFRLFKIVKGFTIVHFLF